MTGIKPVVKSKSFEDFLMSKKTVEIDEMLLLEAKEIAGLIETEDVVNFALENLVRKKRLQTLARELRGSGVGELSDRDLCRMRT